MLLAAQVHQVLLVVAVKFHDLSVGDQMQSFFHGPRLRVRFRVVDGNLDVHMAEVATPESFGYMQLFRRRMAGFVEPGLAVEADGIDNQRIPIPFADRRSEPVGLGVLRKRAAVRKDLAVEGQGLMKNRRRSAGLDDSEGKWNGVEFGNTWRQAIRVRLLL